MKWTFDIVIDLDKTTETFKTTQTKAPIAIWWSVMLVWSAFGQSQKTIIHKVLFQHLGQWLRSAQFLYTGL